MTDMGRLLREQMESFSRQLQQLTAANTQQAGDPAAGGGNSTPADAGG